MHVHRKRGWEVPEREVTPESAYRSRRAFLALAGLTALGGATLIAGVGKPRPRDAQAQLPDFAKLPTADRYPAARNQRYTVDRALSEEKVAAAHNNFYEFTTDKGRVWELAKEFHAWPWTVEVAGLVSKPGKLDVEQLIRSMPLEERVYRFRCVEAWAMTVPWTGFPLRKLIEQVQPTSQARFVRFTSFLRPAEAVGQKTQTWYPWPYYEALRMDEAMHELAMVTTGIYGHPLPNQHGAPLRVIVPWKYGYKNPKSFVKIEFVAEQPRTFWNDLAPDEYSFLSNVNPNVPHPRWSQAKEQLIGSGDHVPTRMFNGYEEFVAAMYPQEVRGAKG
jgi:sulfoxide reductase catalytic subunit YedY